MYPLRDAELAMRDMHHAEFNQTSQAGRRELRRDMKRFRDPFQWKEPVTASMFAACQRRFVLRDQVHVLR
jgi:hypothetical protein